MVGVQVGMMVPLLLATHAIMMTQQPGQHCASVPHNVAVCGFTLWQFVRVCVAVYLLVSWGLMTWLQGAKDDVA